MPAPDRYSPRDIVSLMGRPLSAGELAATVAAFWPTIKTALQEYHKAHPKARAAPQSSGD